MSPGSGCAADLAAAPPRVSRIRGARVDLRVARGVGPHHGEPDADRLAATEHATRHPQRPLPELHGEGLARSGDADPPAVALDREVDARRAQEARRGHEAALAERRGHAHRAGARQPLQRRRTRAHDRRRGVAARPLGVGRRGDRRPLDGLAVPGHVVERVRGHAVGAVAADHLLGQAVRAAHRVGARAAVEGVDAGAPVDRVAATRALEPVVAVAARDGVAGRPGGQLVGAGPALERDRERQRDRRGVLTLAEVDAEALDAVPPAEHLDDVGVGVPRHLARPARTGVAAAVDRRIAQLDLAAGDAALERVQRRGVGRHVDELGPVHTHQGVRRGGRGCGEERQQREHEHPHGRNASFHVFPPSAVSITVPSLSASSSASGPVSLNL